MTTFALSKERNSSSSLPVVLPVELHAGIDLAPLLQYPAFKELEDKVFFVQFGLEGSIFWENGDDIASETIGAEGECFRCLAECATGFG